MGIPQFDVNLADHEVVADPYPVYEQIRELGPVVRNEMMSAWMVLGFDETMEVLTDTSGRFGEMNTSELTPWFEGPNMIMVDGPEHTRLRRCLSPMFTRQAIAGWEERVAAVVDDLVAPLVEKGRFDIVSDFTLIPTIIVAEMMGIPKDRYEDWRRWSHTIVSNLAYGLEDPEVIAMLRSVGDEANSYLADEIARHRADMPDDLITAMVEQNEMSREEIASTALLLVLAGYDTTAKLLANSLVALDRFRDARAEILADMSLLPAAIEEVLRWVGATHINPRVVVETTTVGGQELAAGEVVYLLHAAANRDPRRWDDALEFDIHREPKAHVGFGFGAHLCLGAPLARLEAKIALERLLALAPDYTVHDVDYGTGILVRGPERGWIEVSPSR